MTAYFLRFRSIQRCVKEDHAAGNIPDYDWIMAQSIPTFTGFFNHLCELNDFTLLDEIQEELENEGTSLKGISLQDVVRSELPEARESNSRAARDCIQRALFR
ncbi:MAG: hypothetical protein ACTSUE_24055 [Promethearchaeota archaeon]